MKFCVEHLCILYNPSVSARLVHHHLSAQRIPLIFNTTNWFSIHHSSQTLLAVLDCLQKPVEQIMSHRVNKAYHRRFSAFYSLCSPFILGFRESAANQWVSQVSGYSPQCTVHSAQSMTHSPVESRSKVPTVRFVFGPRQSPAPQRPSPSMYFSSTCFVTFPRYAGFPAFFAKMVSTLNHP